MAVAHQVAQPQGGSKLQQQPVGGGNSARDNYAVRLGTDDFFEVVGSNLIGSSPLTVTVAESGEDYDSYVWYTDPVTNEQGTPAADLATASG